MTCFPPHLPPGSHSIDGRWAGAHICRPRGMHESICSLLLGELVPVLSSAPKSSSSSAFNVPDQWYPGGGWTFISLPSYSILNRSLDRVLGKARWHSSPLLNNLLSPPHGHSESHHFLPECRPLTWARGTVCTVSSFPKKLAATVLWRNLFLCLVQISNFLFNSFNRCLLRITWDTTRNKLLGTKRRYRTQSASMRSELI